ncbi:MAG: hypothetical protein Ct9H300mP7_2390 [Verrucomicrobiota bacterium]|nr:MAG: hypothetical protein Ct9H300mP7_2390 [Verrucomicrobiota bacterium]
MTGVSLKNSPYLKIRFFHLEATSSLPGKQFNANKRGLPSIPMVIRFFCFPLMPTENLTGFSDGFTFGASENGVTFGRLVTGAAKPNILLNQDQV